MKKFIVAAASFAILAAAPAAASDQTDVLAVIQQQAAAFNKGDLPGMCGVFADDVAILDNISPHAWHGTGACARWVADLADDMKKNSMTHGVVSIGKPKHVVVTGDRAYVVISTGFKAKVKGKEISEPGQLTYAMQKTGSGWRVTGTAWADQ